MVTLLMIYIDNKQFSQFITILSHNANWGTFLGERALCGGRTRKLILHGAAAKKINTVWGSGKEKIIINTVRDSE